MNFKVLSLSEKDEWKNYLCKLPLDQQDIYYTPEYYELYESLGDGKAKCFIYQKGNHIALYPFLINSVNAFGYNLDKEYFDIQGAYGYNGVVANSYDRDFINEFYNEFDFFCEKENIIAQFTRFHPLLKNVTFSEDHLNVLFDRSTVYIDLYKPYEKLFREFQTTTRKQIKRAIKRYNIDVQRFENDISILSDFLNIYTESMKRKNAVPYLFFSKDYFKSLLNIQGCHCFFAFYESKPIAVIVAFFNKKYVHGHLGGILEKYLSMAPFSLLYNEMIQFGQERSCNYLHVGGGATNKPDDALLNYKTNFSHTLGKFFIGKKIHNPEIYKEVVNQWKLRNFEIKDQYNNYLLKYRIR
jgi:hypothetical protein